MDLAAELARFGPAASGREISLEAARAYCRRLATTHYENFTVASRLFPRHLRQHLCNVYAYCRWADDLADEPLTPEQASGLLGHNPDDFAPSVPAGSLLLDWWEEQLDHVYQGRASHPVFMALGETIREFDLPKQPLADLLGAFRRDQVQTRYETLAELYTYCEKSANPVGRLVLCLGRSLTAENVRLADSVCTGLQLANFWQDVKRDYAQGRIYIPQELCRRHNWDESRFGAGKCDAEFRELLSPLVARADTLLVAGQPLIDRVGGDLQFAVRLFIAGGRAILAAITRSGYDVWSRRPTVGRLMKLRLLAAALWQSAPWRG